jgi:hypothetical protein
MRSQQLPVKFLKSERKILVLLISFLPINTIVLINFVSRSAPRKLELTGNGCFTLRIMTIKPLLFPMITGAFIGPQGLDRIERDPCQAG